MVRPGRASASDRWLPIVGAVVLVAGGSLIVLGLDRFVVPCMFRELTGLLCPGCGSGRVLRALARADVAAAWRANPLVVLALPPTLYGLVREIASAWGIAELPWPNIDRRWVWVLFWAIIAFWVLRNVPEWPFTLLAPR